MTAVRKSKVSNGVEADSAAAGDLQPGDRLMTVVELGRNKVGQLRVRPESAPPSAMMEVNPRLTQRIMDGGSCIGEM